MALQPLFIRDWKQLSAYEPQQWKGPLERRRNTTDSSG